MSIDVARLLDLKIDNVCRNYSRLDARLYALSIGFGSDPLNEAELDFVTDRTGFKTVPSMATIFADVIMELTNMCHLEHPELALHGEQRLDIFAPLPESAELIISGVIPEVYDRGENKGAEIHMAMEARIFGHSEPLFRATYVTIARGDGGFGGAKPNWNRVSQKMPNKEPDTVWEFKTQRNQALLYSLNGDPNPIHVQPKIAGAAGFVAPIMHGLGTYGIACRAVLASYCDYEPQRMKSFNVRFSAPIYPGEQLAVEMWRKDNAVSFQAMSKERHVIVLKSGLCQLSG